MCWWAKIIIIIIADIAAAHRSTKYAALVSRYIFQPIAVESLVPISNSAKTFLGFLGLRIAGIPGDCCEGSSSSNILLIV